MAAENSSKSRMENAREPGYLGARLGLRRGFLAAGPDLLDEPEIRAQLLHHPVLDARAASRRLGFRERGLGFLGPAGREVRHPEVMERRGRRSALARAPQALDGAVVLAPLVVHPAERRQRIGLELLGGRREGAAGVVEREVQVLSRLGQA